MKDTNHKLKKWAMIAGLGLVCCVMAVVIGGKFAKAPPADDLPTSSGTVSPEVKPDPNAGEKEPIILVPNPDHTPADTDGADSTGTEQTLQPKPTKPQPPEKPTPAPEVVLTDPDKKPDSKPIVQEPSKPEPPQVGEGEIYIPGFGGVTNEGGGGQGEDSVIDPEHPDFDKIIGY